MKFSYTILQSFFPAQGRRCWQCGQDQKLPKPEGLAELLTMHSFEVSDLEEILNPKSKILNPKQIQNSKFKTDYILDIDILPNRAHDCLSYLGVAREISVLLEHADLRGSAARIGADQKSHELINGILPIKLKKLKVDSKLKIEDFVKIKIEDSAKPLCRRYIARVISDIKIKPSPKWLRDTLERAGQKPINNIVDATNIVMLMLGQPLHAFDFDKCDANIRIHTNNTNKNVKKIVIRRAKKGEEFVTLDDKLFLLDENNLLIADSRDALAIAGIKGGKKAEIDRETKTIVLESANFNAANIRKTSQCMGLRTDSSLRFSAGLDPNLAETAMDYLAALILEIAGGRLAGGKADIYYPKEIPKRISFTPEEAGKYIGVELEEEKVINILKSLDMEIERSPSRKTLLAIPPTIRLDLTCKQDIFEEIARVYGYENLPLVAPFGLLVPPRPNAELRLERGVKETLSGMRLSEVYNYSFVNSKEIIGLEKMMGEADLSERLVYLANPASSDKDVLRPNLTVGLIKTALDNLKTFDEVRVFEIGKVFKRRKKSGVSEADDAPDIIEKKMLSVLTTGKKKTKGAPAKEFYDLKGTVLALLEKLGVNDAWLDNFEATPENSAGQYWHKNRTAEIKVGDKEIGFIGEINPRVLEEYGIREKIVLFEIDFAELANVVSGKREYRPISRFPSLMRDLAIVVDSGTKVADVLNVVEIKGGELLFDTDLFDIYEGENLPNNGKSMAFHLVFQSSERTLSDSEVNDIMEKIINAVKEEGWEIRG